MDSLLFALKKVLSTMDLIVADVENDTAINNAKLLKLVIALTGDMT